MSLTIVEFLYIYIFIYFANEIQIPIKQNFDKSATLFYLNFFAGKKSNALLDNFQGVTRVPFTRASVLNIGFFWLNSISVPVIMYKLLFRIGCFKKMSFLAVVPPLRFAPQ